MTHLPGDKPQSNTFEIVSLRTFTEKATVISLPVLFILTTLSAIWITSLTSVCSCIISKGGIWPSTIWTTDKDGSSLLLFFGDTIVRFALPSGCGLSGASNCILKALFASSPLNIFVVLSAAAGYNR